jgi:ATP-dependent DNA helicase RecG
LGDTKSSILKAITDNNKISITQLAQQFSLSTTAIEKQIAQLKQADLLERVGSAKGGHWVVKLRGDKK